MTKNKEIAKENEYFMKDARLFLLWRMTKEKFLPTKRDYIPLYELFHIEQYPAILWFEDLRINIELDSRFGMHFYSDAEKYKKLPSDEEILKNFSNKSYHKKILSSAKNIRENNFISMDFTYLSKILWDDAASEIYLVPKEWVKQEDIVLIKKLDEYIQKFINGELLIADTNYFNFQKQRQLFIGLIRDMKALEEYGKNFIISNRDNTLNPFYKNDSTLFIHTIYALEYLWYLRVLNLDFSGASEYYPDYKVNILPSESFKELIYQDFKKENPKTVIEWYDEKKWTLSFAWKKITISKSGKETDAKLLLATLMKAEWEDYIYNDEILEDWWYNDEDQKNIPKNKVYFAGQAVNKAMQLQTSIEDFLDITTTKARISPKYRK